MTIDEFVRLLSAKGRHPKWRAKCPVHKSRALTLAIYQDKDGIGLHCHAGCLKDDILKALGLSWRDLKVSKEWLPPEEYKAVLKAKHKAQYEEQQLKRKIMYWIDEVSRWETIASLLHTHMLEESGNPMIEQHIAKLWHEALWTARDRNLKLQLYWPKAPEVWCYEETNVRVDIAAKHVGPEIAVALGLIL